MARKRAVGPRGRVVPRRQERHDPGVKGVPPLRRAGSGKLLPGAGYHQLPVGSGNPIAGGCIFVGANSFAKGSAAAPTGLARQFFGLLSD
ncbi:hypothetical protein D3C86_1945050 [compost metagenome]